MSDDESKSGCTSTPMVILALIFFWPVGLALMWTGRTFNLVIRILITLFFLGTVFLSLTLGLLTMSPGCDDLPPVGAPEEQMGDFKDQMKEARERMMEARDRMKEAQKKARDEFAGARDEMLAERKRIKEMIEAFKQPSEAKTEAAPATESRGKVWSHRKVKPSKYEHVSVDAQEIKPLRPVEFETGSDVIRDASHSLLDEVVKASREHGVSKLLVGGHTDDVGADSDNMRLSQRRADSVKRYLESKKIGIQLLAIGFGETRPIAKGESDQARAQNRRVEFQIIEQAAKPQKSTSCSGEPDEAACLEQRCEKGQARACLERAEQLRGEDEPKRRVFNKKACDGGDLLGCTKLGAMHERGDGGDKNEAEAFRLYKQACDGDIGDGCNNLGYLYENGVAVAQDSKEAVRIYEKGCGLKTGEACSNLGLLYEDGKGVAVDLKKAAALHREACDLEVGGGCSNLASMYRMGQGVDRDPDQAKALNKKACDLGFAPACKRLQRLR